MFLTFKHLFIILLIPILFVGCSSKYIAPGASSDQITQLSVAMIANSDISCDANYGSYYIKKGTIFAIKEIGKIKFKTRSNSPFGVSDMLSGYTFPDNALFLPFQSDLNENADNGLIVYPNGKFIYNDNYGAAYDPTGGNWWLHKGKCKFNDEFPFTLKDYR